MSNEILEMIGRNIKYLRNTMNWNQENLSEKTGIPRSSISKYERGKLDISVVNLIKLSDVFECNIEDLTKKEMGGYGMKRVIIEHHSFKNYQIIKRPDIEVKLTIGSYYKIEPLNLSKKKNRGRICELINFEGSEFNPGMVTVKFVDTKKITSIDAGELVPATKEEKDGRVLPETDFPVSKVA